MEKNYTDINLEKLKKQKSSSFNTILLLVLTIATGILAILLFFLIQKKTKGSQNALPKELPAAISPAVSIPTITTGPSPTILPSPPVSTPSVTIASPSPTIATQVSPTSTPSETVTNSP